MKNKRNIKCIGLVLLITLIILVTSILIILNILNNKQYTELVQLSAQSSRQMMGYILKTKDGKMIIIDGGTIDDTQNLMKYIEKNNNKVDYWFITHAHDDHAGAFTQIVNNENIQIDNIYISLNDYEWYEENEPARAEFTKTLMETLKNEKIAKNVKEPILNEMLEIDNIKVEILEIKNPEFTENPGNEQSMVIKFDTGKTTFLVLGDTGEKSSEKLLLTQKEKLKSDIVQMAHHGQAGATEELYKQINPTICMWPTPEWLWNNDPGTGENTGIWKTFETRDWMKKLNVKKNYIAKDGDITIKIK